jgi:hypothetical protein
MDDSTSFPPTPRTRGRTRVVGRACEAGRLQGQILAQAYQRVFPPSRVPLASAPAAGSSPKALTSARAAAGA